jgi:hypothetical protein
VAAGQTTAAGNAAPLAIHRLLVLQQGKGASGQTVVANVLGSVPGGGVALHWDKANGPVMATSTGSAAGSAVMAFKVPVAAIGNHTVYATSAGAVMTALFTVTSTNVPPPAPQGLYAGFGGSRKRGRGEWYWLSGRFSGESDRHRHRRVA